MEKFVTPTHFLTSYVAEEPEAYFNIKDWDFDLSEEDLVDDNTDLYIKICHYFAKFGYRLYGQKYIAAWIKDHPGDSFLAIPTSADMALVDTIIKSNTEVWDQLIEIEKIEDPDERAKYVPRIDLHLVFEFIMVT